MKAAVIIWALTLLSITASLDPEPHYMVVVPAILHHPNVEKVCVLLSSLPENVHLTVTLEMKTRNHSIVEKDVAKPGIFECISFQVPAFTPTRKTREAEEVAHVHVLIHKGDSVSFEGRKKVLVREVFIRNIVESDKPFYKPGETVRFRIVRLDEEFKALHGTIPLVQLKDPNDNRIGQWRNVETKQGIADLSFPLASEAALGLYNIKVGEDTKYMTGGFFMVEEYELPKFEVLFELPPAVTISDEEFVAKTCAKYTYGKPVHGTVHLTVTKSRSLRDYFSGDYSEIEKEYTGQTDKTGCASFTIHAADINMTEAGYMSRILLSAEFVDEETGMTNRASDYLSLRSKEVSVEFVGLNPFYKQGFPYSGTMKLSDGREPAQNETVYLTVEVHDVETHLSYVTDEKGEAHFTLDTTNWDGTLVSIRGRHSIQNVTQGDLDSSMRIRLEAFNWLKPFYSESNSFLEIQHVEEELPCGKEQEVLVDYIIDRKELGPEDDHVDIYYLVVTKGRIVSSGQKQVPIGQDETLKGTFSLSLSVSMDLAPTARLLLFAVFADGEVAADVDDFTIEKCLRHQVSLDFSKEEDVPGSEVSLQVEAAPGAWCSLRAVDKSVILKEEVNQMTSLVQLYGPDYGEDIISGRGFSYHLEDFEPYPCLLPSPRGKRSLPVAPWYQSEADVYSLIKLLKMKVITNAKIKKPVSCEHPQYERMVFRSDKAVPMPQSVTVEDRGIQHSDSEEKKEKEKPKPRTHFPETWIWDLVPVNEEGKASRLVTAPDTITEWRGDAFCVADIGIGLSQPATFRVFQPFFVDMVLPYSVVRGETFELKATVFNYLKDCIQVNVRLAESQQVDVKPCLTCHFTACLCSEEAQTFSWNVTATQLGHVSISVTTEAEETQELCGNRISVTPTRGRSDTVIKPLLVKPEGVLKEETYNVLLCSAGDPVVVEDDISLKLPENFVEDSGRATFSVIGDILGSSLHYLDHLLQMPFGCGEQNMVKFVPNIFVLRYLEATNQASPEIKAKAMEHMKKGYQRQLLYQHDNGSYSAFGQRDTEGNTWLTAFVARAFGQAKSYIFIDEKHIQDTVHWLEDHQHTNGCFASVGRLFNNALKGGVDDEYSLTAYVTAALLELHLENNSTMVENALECLKRNLSFVEEAYPRALLAYVFTLAGDMEIRQQLLNDLGKQAHREEGIVAWSDIETTAYVLLAHLSKPQVTGDDIQEASLIASALVKEQNPYGGFYSTQDTVVGLQALSLYAALTYREIENVQVQVKSTTGFQHEFHVDKENRLMLQQTSLPEVPGQYKVVVSGNGCAYVQSTLRYNQPPEKCDAFSLSVETLPKECNRATMKYFDIHLRVSYTGQRERSNMALLEVNMLSGYIPVKKSAKALLEKPLVKKVEIEPDTVSIYLDELDSEEQHYSFSVEQEFDIKDLKPVTAKVYDYYHPDDFAVAEYNAPCSTETAKEDQAHSVTGD